jgi:hypothetical protein
MGAGGGGRRLAFVAVGFAARTALATGACEDTPIRYDPPSHFAPRERQFAFSGTSHWCEEKDDSAVIDEVRGTVRFVEIRDIAGKLVARLSTARGRDAARLREAVRSFDEVAPGRMAATLASRGFEPLAATARSPAGDCRVRARYDRRAPPQNGFPAGVVAVEVVAGKHALVTHDVGVAARELRAGVVARAQFLPAEHAVAVWVRVPQCNGGPPPGYWGEGFPGTCYHEDTIAIVLLTVTEHPELAVCFAE